MNWVNINDIRHLLNNCELVSWFEINRVIKTVTNKCSYFVCLTAVNDQWMNYTEIRPWQSQIFIAVCMLPNRTCHMWFLQILATCCRDPCSCLSTYAIIKPKFLSFVSITFAILRKETISFLVFIRPYAWNYSVLTGRIFIKFDIWVFFEILSRKLIFH